MVGMQSLKEIWQEKSNKATGEELDHAYGDLSVIFMLSFLQMEWCHMIRR